MGIILIGFMGAGKSTVARCLQADFVDLDQAITEKIGMPIADFFAKFGEDEFRQVEKEVFRVVIEQENVVATGGGIVESALNLARLREHEQVVYLQADFDVLWARICGDEKNLRPLAQQGQVAARELFEHRQALYESVADLIVDVSVKTPEEIALEIRNYFTE